jgi:1,4-alpha-glucan branching enzyme
MAKKDEVKKVAVKTTKTTKPATGPVAKAAEAKAPAKAAKKPVVQKKQAAQKKQTKALKKPGTTFKLEAPQAERVFVAGCFNEWDPTANPLERGEEGIWSCTLAVDPGEHEYRFIVDGVWWDDPGNELRCWNDFGTQNCVLIIRD